MKTALPQRAGCQKECTAHSKYLGHLSATSKSRGIQGETRPGSGSPQAAPSILPVLDTGIGQIDIIWRSLSPYGPLPQVRDLTGTLMRSYSLELRFGTTFTGLDRR